MRKLTASVGKRRAKTMGMDYHHSSIKKILVIRPNHRLGNLLLITPLIQELHDLYPNAKIDIVVKGNLAKVLFKEYQNINQLIILPRKAFKEFFLYIRVFISVGRGKYDLAINTNDNSSSGRILTRISKASHKLFGDQDNDNTILENHLAKKSIVNLRRYLASFGKVGFLEKNIPNLSLKLTAAELKIGKSVLDKLVPSKKPTLCIFTFATGIKCHSKKWWHTFYSKLSDSYADQYNIIEVLPAENVSQIDFIAPSYYSRDIREMAAVFNATKLCIAADSGIMHLSSASEIPTIGLFNHTDPKKYEPYNLSSKAVDTNAVSIDDLVLLIDDILQH